MAHRGHREETNGCYSPLRDLYELFPVASVFHLFVSTGRTEKTLCVWVQPSDEQRCMVTSPKGPRSPLLEDLAVTDFS